MYRAVHLCVRMHMFAYTCMHFGFVYVFIFDFMAGSFFSRYNLTNLLLREVFESIELKIGRNAWRFV